MKHSFYITIILAMLIGMGTAEAHKNCDSDWKQKMMSEKIAFLTVETGITPEEAQTFWPVYNEINKKKDEAMHNVFKTYKNLEDALEAGKSEKEIERLMEDYIEALETQKEIDSEAVEKYRKVLPVEKVAKLYIGEEKFRRQHIRKLHNKPGDKPSDKK